jgi:hypothetical protein
MFDWWNALLTQLSTWWTWFTAWAGGIADSLNPIALILSIADWALSFLPQSDGAANSLWIAALQVLDSATIPWTAADLFVNMGVFASCVGLVMATETALAVSRVWRFIRSHVV